MFDFLNMALMGIMDPMKLAAQMASQNIAPATMQAGIGAMAQPQIATGGTIPMPGDMMGAVPSQHQAMVAQQQAGPGTQVADLDQGIFDQFMRPILGKVTNPHGRAAIAATGLRESGFSAGNAFREWNDGENNAGGIMSWNGPRLNALKRFGGSADMKGLSPDIQAAYFLQENPSLIESLNGAKSNSEAMRMMNNAWAFKGYNDPSHPETKARFEAVERVGPLFENMGVGANDNPMAAQMREQSIMRGGIESTRPQAADMTGSMQGILDTMGGDNATAAAMAGDTPGPMTLADKLAAMGKGLKVPEGGGSSAPEPPRIAGGLTPNVGGGFGRNPQSIEQLFALLGGTSPMQSPVPSLSQLIKGV